MWEEGGGCLGWVCVCWCLPFGGGRSIRSIHPMDSINHAIGRFDSIRCNNRIDPIPNPPPNKQTNIQTQTQQNVARLRERGGVTWLLGALKTDRDKGIDSAGVGARLAAFGSNKVCGVWRVDFVLLGRGGGVEGVCVGVDGVCWYGVDRF